MTTPNDGLRMIQSRLCEAVERLQRESTRLSDAAIATRMGEIERVAHDHGMHPLAHLARAGAHASMGPGHRSGPRRALACHLERMEDACRCTGPNDVAAIMASIAIRLR